MKTLIFILFFFLALTTSNFSQWIQINSGTSNRFLTCHFINENVGWAAGDDGTIIKTTDGGDNWSFQSVNTSDKIHSIFFIDSLYGWIALYEFIPARHGSIMHTTDGGDTWTTQFSISGATLFSIYFSDQKNGWAAGSSGVMFKTTNEGESWSDISPVSGFWLYSVFFIDDQVGWISGGLPSQILKTTNGGSNWIAQSIPVSERIMSVFFLDLQNGWAVGAGGRIVKTTNGGNNWDFVPSPVVQELRNVRFSDNMNGWAVGLGGVILHSLDGGASWSIQNSNTSENLFGVSFANNVQGWAVGENGVILKYSDYSELINILAPNGGEIITAGSTYFIEWNSQNVVNVKIEYSTDNGTNWISITDSIPSTGIYDWTVPNTYTTQGRVKISDLSDPDIFDISDGSFTIQSSKVITVISPNGGEILDGGSQYEILWNSEDVEYVKLEHSINNGASWNSITDSTESTGVFMWTVPNILTTQARIKISDISLPSIYDASDAPFRINYVVSVDENVMVTFYKLYQNYPNPFNPSTIISWQLPETKFVTLKIYDVLGNEVASLINEEKPAGIFEVEFSAIGGSASGGNTSALSSGIYYYKLVAGNFIDVKKMILLK